MPKTKRDKKRKHKLNQYKIKTKKMSKNGMKPFTQTPVWSNDDKFEITGREFSIMKDFMSLFSEPMAVLQSIFARNLNNGVIKVKYEDSEGKEISREQVDEMIQKMESVDKNAQKVEESETVGA